jgi:hypothetical protein
MFAKRRVNIARKPKGQALMESLVAASVLVPLLILGIYLAKVQSVQQSSIAASRALAFECQVSFNACGNFASNSVLGDEIRRRHFMHPSLPLFSNEGADDAAAAGTKQMLWNSHRGTALLESYADVGFRIDPDTFNAGSGVAGNLGQSIATNALNLVSAIAGPSRFGLNWQGGLIDAKVQANLSKSNAVNSLVASLDAIPLSMKAHTATLTDGWNASSAVGGEAGSTQSRVDQGRKLPLLEPAVDILYAPTRAFIWVAEGAQVEPRASHFRYHEVDVSVVPADRLPGYVAPGPNSNPNSTPPPVFEGR